MLIKEYARKSLFLLKKKSYLHKEYNGAFLKSFKRGSEKEFFFGYYDRCPERKGKVVFHEMNDDHVDIIVREIKAEKDFQIGKSTAYNWQMGARTIWIDDDTISYNDFDGEKYVCKWYSLSQKQLIKTIPMPLMDIYLKDYVLTTNYQRLRSVDPDYSYCCLPEMDDSEFYDYDNDGIWLYDLEKENKRLLLSIKDILAVKKNMLHTEGKHCINHIMIAPDGKSFMFIHRYRVNGKKYDRLMVYDLKQLRCLLDDPLQSHFCWLDNHTIMGYCGYGGQVGWFQADTITGKVEKLEELTKAHPKNGHPTPYGEWIVVDSYPNLSRMQELHAYHRRTKKIIKLAELYHDMQHHNYNRCDLHPRFTLDGTAIYVDTLYSGSRQLCKFDIKLN